jgi:hypothetical protein
MTVTHGFELLRQQNIPELNALVRLYRHVKTGAELLSVINDDENKVFGITFCTPPNTSNGIAHIMEHSVLCGSRKYPVKEPFVELVKGSLNTFVNAWTFPDKTSYPLASQNLQDFYNLVDVYLDAVFYPNITPYTLKQEGWHYELDAPDHDMTYKGVVFNEMKGAYSDPENVFARYIQQSLFPDNTYGVDSGGDPSEILNLTYDEFKRFHDTYYHPSNALIYFYGDDPEDERLRIANGYLKDFDRIEVPARIALQARFDAPRQQTFTYAVGPDEEDNKRGFVTVNWLLPEGSDSEMSLAFAILNHILIGTPASPLRKALIDSGLGEDLAGVQLEQDLRQMFFSTGLKGIAVEDSGNVEAIIHQTLSNLAEKGIDAEMIEAAVNTIEFALRENNTGSFPRGLLLMVRALRTWLHEGDPVAPLAYEAPLAAIKQRLAAGERFFEGLIGSYLLDNAHRTTVLLQPDPELQQRQDAAEQERLAQARARMTPADVDRVVEETRRLKEMQETPDSPAALATIPSLKLADLDQQNKLIPLQTSTLHGAQIVYHDLFTNGIVYLDLGFNLHALPQEYLPYVTLFFRALLEIGTDTEDFVKLSQRIGRKTGGIDPTHLVSTVLTNGQATAWGLLRGKATTAQAREMLAILKDVLLTVKLDHQERFRQIVLEEKAAQESDLVPAGHRVALSRLRARFSEADWANEQIGGTEYLLFLRQLADAVDKNWPAVLDKLETMRRLLINRNTALCNVTLDEEQWTLFQPQLADFLAALPAQSPALQRWQPGYEAVSEGLTVPAQVNYVGKGANLYRLGYQAHGSVIPISNYLNTSWLWERVRVHGGAYGAFNVFDRRSGTYVFVSYRDPNLLQTLENYDQTAHYLQNLDLSQEEVVKTIIGAIGLVDAYQLPDAKGYTSLIRYLTGEKDEMRQQLRDQILSTTAADFKNFGKVLEQVNANGLVAVVGSADAIEKANAERGGNWLRVQKVL